MVDKEKTMNEISDDNLKNYKQDMDYEQIKYLFLRGIGQAWSELREGYEDERSMVWEFGDEGFESRVSLGNDEGVICALCWCMRKVGGAMLFVLWAWV